MEQNKTSKYLKYAIGEIILVVIGILIALQINNWNQNRINSSKEQKYLVGLSYDLEKQIEALDNRIQFYDIIKNVGTEIIDEYNQHGKLTKIDNINRRLSIMMYSNAYPEVNTTFNELNSTGQLNLISLDSLRTKIIKYYQSSETGKKSVDSNTNEVTYEHIFPIIKSSVIIQPRNFGYDSIAFNQDVLKESMTDIFDSKLNASDHVFDLINAISLRIVVAETNRGTIESIHEEAIQLLHEINDYKTLTNHD